MNEKNYNWRKSSIIASKQSIDLGDFHFFSSNLFFVCICFHLIWINWYFFNAKKFFLHKQHGIRSILYSFLVHVHHSKSAMISNWSRTQKYFVNFVVCVEKKFLTSKKYSLTQNNWNQLQMRKKIEEKISKSPCSIDCL